MGRRQAQLTSNKAINVVKCCLSRENMNRTQNLVQTTILVILSNF